MENKNIKNKQASRSKNKVSNRNRLHLLSAFAALALMAGTASAASVTTTISRIGISGTEGYLWSSAGNWPGSGCSDPGIVVLDISTEEGKLLYKTALAGYLAGKTVKVHFITGVCNGSYVEGTRIDLMP